MSTIEFNEALLSLEHYLKSFAFTYTKNLEDAEDLTQETLLRAMKYRGQYRPKTNFKAWVFTIMKNIFINQYRRKVRGGMIFDRTKDLYFQSNVKSDDDPISLALGNELRSKVDALSEDCREPFQMHQDGYKYQEIAEHLEIPIGTVKSRIFLARKKLMQSLPDYQYLLTE
ncbi:MAG: RNA polymerase sigma factor [Bacteroidetes bacterium]|nr:MAG: RNA polymerase sigma factor [Bacteroidota bacterium]